MVLNNNTVSVITVKSFAAPLHIYCLNRFKWPHNMCWTAITQQKAYIFKGTQSVAWSVCELALTRALTWPHTQQRERGRLQKEVVKDTSMGNGENLGMTESVSPDMFKRCQKSLRGKPALNHLCSILSPTSLILPLAFSFSLSLSWQEPRAEVWLMPVCSSSERTKEPAHSRERSHLAKTESFDSEERVNFSLAELKVFL